jgi:hypothetical protein
MIKLNPSIAKEEYVKKCAGVLSRMSEVKKCGPRFQDKHTNLEPSISAAGVQRKGWPWRTVEC